MFRSIMLLDVAGASIVLGGLGFLFVLLFFGLLYVIITVVSKIEKSLFDKKQDKNKE